MLVAVSSPVTRHVIDRGRSPWSASPGSDLEHAPVDVDLPLALVHVDEHVTAAERERGLAARARLAREADDPQLGALRVQSLLAEAAGQRAAGQAARGRGAEDLGTVTCRARAPGARAPGARGPCRPSRSTTDSRPRARRWPPPRLSVRSRSRRRCRRRVPTRAPSDSPVVGSAVRSPPASAAKGPPRVRRI